MKPILFNTEMVKAILDGRKTQTRRIIKPQESLNNGYKCTGFILDTTTDKENIGCFRFDHEKYLPIFLKPRYSAGDILWVMETWGNWSYDNPECNAVYYQYRADYPDGATTYEWPEPDDCGEKIICDLPKWRRSIHMPREAARIFLRVANVRVERLQKITPYDAWNEGCRIGNSFSLGEHIPELQQQCRDIVFKTLWNSTIKKQDLDTYGWNANPWVWVYEFERVSD